MMGCIINPDRGPAIQTSDVRDLVRPSASRYGVQSVLTQLVAALHYSR